MTPGLRIGRYEVGELLGKGSFGVVHLARDVELGREVAIKFLRPEFGSRPEMVQRFLQEARAAAKIGHPGIVTVFECGLIAGTGRHDGTAYIVMERLAGTSLGERTGKHAWTYPAIVAIVRQLALALHAAHTNGIIHRDLKPDNVFLVPDAAVVGGERAKILDFGIAKLDDPGPGGIQTHSRMILGTPRYMSPEQARSSTNVDARSDIYALGCMLYELIAGRTPFEGDSGDIMFHHQATEVPALDTLVDNVPAGLATLLAQMLEKSPDRRPASMQAVDGALATLELEAVRPLLKERPRFVAGPVITGVAEPPRPKRISIAGELPVKPVDGRPPPRDSAQRVKIDLEALPTPSEELTAPSQKLAQLVEPAPVARVERVVERSADRATLATRRPSSNVAWFAAAGGILLLLGLVLVVRCGDSAPARRPLEPTDPPVAPTTPDAATVAPPPRTCEAELARREWPALERCARELAPAPRGRQLLELATAEAQAEVELRAITAAIATADLAGATQRAAAIPGTSVYRVEASEAVAAVRRAFVAQQVAALEELVDTHNCEGVARLRTAIEQAHGRAVLDEIAGRAPTCVAIAAAPMPAPKKPEPLDCLDKDFLKTLERQGDARMTEGQFAVALTSFERVFQCKAQIGVKAYLAACRARNFPKARMFFRAMGRDSLAQICLKEGFDPR